MHTGFACTTGFECTREQTRWSAGIPNVCVTASLCNFVRPAKTLAAAFAPHFSFLQMHA